MKRFCAISAALGLLAAATPGVLAGVLASDSGQGGFAMVATDPLANRLAFAGVNGPAHEPPTAGSPPASVASPGLRVPADSKARVVPGRGAHEAWPGWRGATRDGQAAWLPPQLPPKPRVLWSRPCASSVLAGPAVAQGVVLSPDRDLLDAKDVFLGLRATDGEPLWRVEYPATGRLDYGQSPRATPMVQGDHAFLLGAFGHLRCVDLATGKEIWKRNLATDFDARTPKWGWSAAPLVVDDKLIVNPGSPSASLVALDRFTGRVVWKTRGAGAAYAAFILAELGGRRQVVGYDAVSLGGWDPGTGRRLWTLVPPATGDFNVPTPLVVEGRLLVSTENNGTRLYAFGKDGVILPKPVAENRTLSPDSSSPVLVAGRPVGFTSGLHMLDAGRGLRTIWSSKEEGFEDFATLIASGDRLLAVSMRGDALLYTATQDGLTNVSRIRLSDTDGEMYAHPALSGHTLLVRQPSALVCLDLDP